MTIALTVNGKAASVAAEPDTPLLWVLRERLGLTGTKFGCGSGLCGACTVHIDGKAVRSCQVSVSQAQGKKVTRGDVLGFVGTTGNAHPNAPHMHFAIYEVEDPKGPWRGRPIDPYPLWR